MSTPAEIATAAVQLKKPNKNDAHSLVLALAKQYGIPADEIAPLYTYFMPLIPAKAKTPEQWVGKAMGVRDVRYYLNFYYSDGTRLICTDGHRLHLMPTTLAEGFYDKALNAVNTQGRYPDVDRVINLSDRTEHIFVKEDAVVKPHLSPSGFVYEMPHGGIVDKRYWDEIIGSESVVTYAESNDNMLVEFGAGRLAVVLGGRDR